MSLKTEVLKTTKALKSLIIQDNSQENSFDFEIESDFEELVKSIQLMEAIYPFTIIMLCKRKHPSVPYVSKNVLDLLGYTAENLKKMWMEEFFSLVHTEDIKRLRLCLEYMQGVVMTYSPLLDPEKYRFVFYYRLRSSGGNYVYLSDEKIVIQNQNKKQIWLTLLSIVGTNSGYKQVRVQLNKFTNQQMTRIYEFIPKASSEQFRVKSKSWGVSVKKVTL